MKKITLILMVVLVLSMPLALAESVRLNLGVDSKDNKVDSNTRIRAHARAEIMEEIKQEKRENRNERRAKVKSNLDTNIGKAISLRQKTREEFKERKEKFIEKREKLAEVRVKAKDCKGDSEKCEMLREEILVRSQDHLLTSIEHLEGMFKKLKIRITNSESIENKEDILANIDAKIEVANKLYAEINAMENPSKEELKVKAKAVKILFVESKQNIKLNSNLVISHRIKAAIHKSEKLLEKLNKLSLKLEGESKTEFDAKIEAFNLKLTEAKTELDLAVKINSEGEFQKAKEHIKEAYKRLKEAHEELKQAARIVVKSKVSLNAEKEVENDKE